MNERIDTSQWQRLGALFDWAIGLDATEQAELLRTTGLEDAELAQALASLLAADARHQARTAEHRERVLQGSLAAIEVPSVVVGDRVGPYVLREKLGQGGMGVVFRAQRADGQVQQEVALKVVKRALLDASGRERFLREREIVAGFQHPSIAHMLDVGQTADGSPYLAMELIRGLAITGWCDANKLDTRRRVDLFLRVCEAVQHAHANLVLHRDLKPSNVLVGDDGVPKLIDFGIAKPLTIMSDEEHQQTVTAHRYFSPGNVAPEQLRGDRVGVACDIYQLGTLLHELLCGATVFDAVGLTPGQFERRILEDAPEAPSVRAARASDATAQAHGAASPAALARDLRGDLDAIVALSLRKPPRERYGSVEQLADDLRRCLDGRPVAAVRGQRWYPLRKFLRRNALAVGAAMAAVLLVGAFVTALLVQSQRIENERDRAELVAQFLTNVFKGADPTDPLSRNQPIGVVLDSARDRLVAQLGQDPGLQVQMLSTLAGVYVDLDDTNTARTLLGNAEFILKSAPSVDPRIVLTCDLQIAQLQAHLGDRQAERDFANRALAVQRSLGDSPGKRWEARLLQTDSSYARGTTADLDAMQALLQELAHDPDVPEVDFAEELVQLGKGYANANLPAEAEPLVRQGLPILEAKLPARHPYVLDARQTEAALLVLSQHRGEEGMKTMQDVMAIRKSRDGEHSIAYAHSLMILGQMYSQMNQSDDAISATQKACESLNQGNLRTREDLMNCSSILGHAYEHMDGKLELAAASYAEAESIATAINGDYSDSTRKFRADLGRVLGRQGRLDEAERLLAASYRPPFGASPMGSPDDASIAIDYADVLHRLHRNGQASVTLDSVQPLLLMYPDKMHDETVAAEQLRKAIAIDK